MNPRPRKRFGQHFLTDPSITASLLDAISPSAEDEIIEIGPGRGALTEALAASGASLTVIEIDRDLAAALASQLGTDFPAMQLITEDALKLDLHNLLASKRQPVRVVGNLPYNISTPLLFKLFTEVEALADMHFMLQREVVARMTASPGQKAYGRLSVMTAFHCQAESLFEVPPQAFTPAPKVTSAVVRLRPNQQKPKVPAPLLNEIVSHAFAMRRKTLRHSLGKYLQEDRLVSLGIDPSLRPEKLSLADFVRCATEAGRQ